MKVAVTGASGFVGGAVCRVLAAAGLEVFAFGRRPSCAPAHVGGAPYLSWDLTTGPLSPAPSVDAVVHCAGSVTDWGPAADFFAVNADGTRHALASFPGARFVHVSTASVYDPYRPTVRAVEDEAPVTRYLNAYGASKAAAERVAAAGPTTIILRPHAIYGPGDTTLLPRVLAAVRGRILPAVGTGNQLVSLTSVTNLAQACLLALQSPITQGIYNITDDSPVTIDWAFREILKIRRIKARPIYLPQRALMPAAALLEATHLLTHRKSPPKITRYTVSHLAVERTLDITQATKTLSYTPTPTSFAGAATW